VVILVQEERAEEVIARRSMAELKEIEGGAVQKLTVDLCLTLPSSS
jgi:hypothetical protein